MLKFKIIYIALFALILSQDRDQIRFPHDYHIEEEELTCEECHESIELSEAIVDHSFLPSKDLCADCHEDAIDKDSEDSDCVMCHTNESAPLSYPEKQRVMASDFSHGGHLDRFKSCAICHGGIESDDGSGQAFVWTPNDCNACHSTHQPETHTFNWQKEHGLSMNGSVGESCSQCHDNTYCDNCHRYQQFTPLTHPTNYIMQHGWEAVSGFQECSTCHSREQDCVSCHEQQNVMPMNHNFPNWAGLLSQDGGEHSIYAKDTPELCQTCHRPQVEESCSRCHGERP
ncbi:MAG: hypothetical protein ISR82_03365 [Candidatus Marinimicrobia bacterium]|nr:hypothetical protein [Candidatus Neomarinimicrobiota bacterium]MBL7010242.1 hypothetical protein [Candidatus Neomarinimicrobiota bacterium]MBL7030657.1 hypothetical protein [Candidatus Neomarinimicrobiota bacterium]